MFKVILVTLFITPTGTEFHKAEFIGEGNGMSSKAFKECQYLARQREYTFFTPPKYLGAVHLCQLD